MIKISGNIITPNNMGNDYSPNNTETKIINILSSSSNTYEYTSLDQLKFELNLRSNIINASITLDKSEVTFKTFRKSICNSNYWGRTSEGGFLLKSDVKPSDAIKDIFINSSKYGTECATAMVIVYYKALLDIYPEKLFNEVFPSIHLMDWYYIDRDLSVIYYKNVPDFLPGDCRYFKNPDVNPLTPEWQGENTIDLGNGTYYGHGIGIKNADQIIRALNSHRKIDAKESAYLLDSVKRLNFKHLSNIYFSYNLSSRLQREWII